MIIFADENDENIRLDAYLSGAAEYMSRAKVQDLIKTGFVTVNGEAKKPSYTLKNGDKVWFEFPDNEELHIKPQDIELDIVYEDENIAVVNKPSGMITHPTPSERENTLVNALLYKFGDNLSDINGEYRPGIVHRLDRNTSGLLIIAKNNEAHEFISNEIKKRNITKKYRTIVKGQYPSDDDVIEAPIGRHPKQPKKMAVVPDGKPSISVIKVIERFQDASYMEVTLITGRTHQIRVHLSYKGHPVFNDTLYGFGKTKVNTQEQVLQSYYLKFTKPFSDEIIELEIEPDEKIKKVLTYLKNRG